MAVKTTTKDTFSAYKRILSDLQSGDYKPCYLLMGEESFYVDKLSSYIAEHTLPEDQKAFNQLILYGNTVTAAQVIDNARRYPMMADRQVVIVREAQQMKGLELFIHYFKAVNPSTVLVLCFMGKSVDKRSAFWNAAQKVCEVLDSNPLRDYEVANWITGYLGEMKYKIEPQAAGMMADFLGTDLQRIAMELDKLFLLMPQGTDTVTTETVERSVGVNRDYSPFTLFRYLSERNFAMIQPIIAYYSDNDKKYPLVMLISLMYTHFSRILRYHAVSMENPTLSPEEIGKKMGGNFYFFKEIAAAARNYSFKRTLYVIDLLGRYDNLYKSSNRGEATDGELLTELVCRIVA